MSAGKNIRVVSLLTEIRRRVPDDADVIRTRFDTVDEFQRHIDDYILRLENGDKAVLGEISIDFARDSQKLQQIRK